MDRRKKQLVEVGSLASKDCVYLSLWKPSHANCHGGNQSYALKSQLSRVFAYVDNVDDAYAQLAVFYAHMRIYAYYIRIPHMQLFKIPRMSGNSTPIDQ